MEGANGKRVEANIQYDIKRETTTNEKNGTAERETKKGKIVVKATHIRVHTHTHKCTK